MQSRSKANGCTAVHFSQWSKLMENCWAKEGRSGVVGQCFSTAVTRPGTGTCRPFQRNLQHYTNQKCVKKCIKASLSKQKDKKKLSIWDNYYNWPQSKYLPVQKTSEKHFTSPEKVENHCYRGPGTPFSGTYLSQSKTAHLWRLIRSDNISVLVVDSLI